MAEEGGHGFHEHAGDHHVDSLTPSVWGIIACFPTTKSAESVEDTSIPISDYTSKDTRSWLQREAELASENSKKKEDINHLNHRLLEAAKRRRQERKVATPEELLGSDVVQMKQRLLDAEQYKREKEEEFKRVKAAAEVMIERQRQQDEAENSVIKHLTNLDLTFGLGTVITSILSNGAPQVIPEADDDDPFGLTQGSAREQELRAINQKFERILGIDGLEVIVFLPSRDGTNAKPRGAILKCEKDSPLIVVEMVIKGARKFIKIDVNGIEAVRKGPGPAIPLPTDFLSGTSRRMHFLLHGKPELNMEFESEAARDAAVGCFKYLVASRRSGIRAEAPPPFSLKPTKVAMDFETPEQAEALFASGLKVKWVGWMEELSGQFIKSFQTKLAVITSDKKLSFYAVPKNAISTFPTMGEAGGRAGPLAKYFDGKFSDNVLRDLGFSKDQSLDFAQILCVVATTNKKREEIAEMNIEGQEMRRFRFQSAAEKRMICEMLEKETMNTRK